MGRTFFVLGALAAGLAVAAGAFGAHLLRGQLLPEALMIFETASRYQFFHGLALLILGGLARQQPGVLLPRAGWCFALGILLFSGSLYALSLTGIKLLGAITPLGGLAFLAGWGILAWWGLQDFAKD